MDPALLDGLVEALLRELPDATGQSRGGAELEAASYILRESPGLRHDTKRLERLFAKRFLRPVWGAMAFLSRRHQLGELHRLSDRFRKRREASDAARPVVVRSAKPLDRDALDALRDRLSRRFGQPITLMVEQDPSLLGGILLRSGDWEYDASVLGRLKRMRMQLTHV